MLKTIAGLKKGDKVEVKGLEMVDLIHGADVGTHTVILVKGDVIPTGQGFVEHMEGEVFEATHNIFAKNDETGNVMVVGNSNLYSPDEIQELLDNGYNEEDILNFGLV